MMQLGRSKGAQLLFLALAIPLLFACKAKQNSVQGQDDNASVEETLVISFERTACFGTCPTFKAEFYSNGKVEYHGINNVANKGRFTGKIEASELEGIYQLAKDIGFFSMKDKYDGPITDVPSQIYFIAMHDAEKKVYSRYKAPPELRTLGEHIDKVLAAITWLPVEENDQ